MARPFFNFNRMTKLKKVHKILILLIAFSIFYICGLFTHLFEKDLADFNNLNFDLQIALQNLKPNDNIDKFYASTVKRAFFFCLSNNKKFLPTNIYLASGNLFFKLTCLKQLFFTSKNVLCIKKINF